MGTFADENAGRLSPAFTFPEPFRLLLDWAESNGWIDGYVDSTGEVVRHAALQEPSTYDLGAFLEFRVMAPAEAAEYTLRWLGTDHPAVTSRLVPFARVGEEGTCVGFWLDDTGTQRIVILGSGSGSDVMCVLAEDPVDLLRLLAIGYREFQWQEEWTSPPQRHSENSNPGWTPVNEPYRRWVTTTFGTTIPETASELVPHPAVMDDENTNDDFANWVNRIGYGHY